MLLVLFFASPVSSEIVSNKCISMLNVSVTDHTTAYVVILSSISKSTNYSVTLSICFCYATCVLDVIGNGRRRVHYWFAHKTNDAKIHAIMRLALNKGCKRDVGLLE